MTYKPNFIIAGVITAGAFIIFSATIVNALFYSPEQEMSIGEFASMNDLKIGNGAVSTSTDNERVTENEEVGLPDRLIVPVLGIDAKIEEVGINTDGNMSAPYSYSSTGWYKYGPRPGEKGSAVIDGHVDNGLALSGVFKNLSNLEKGDNIFVIDKKGKWHTFLVSHVETYPYQLTPVQDIFSEQGDPRLVLITCEGSWIRSDQTYDQRLVVTAELVR